MKHTIQKLKRTSKVLSLLLRHRPEAANIKLDKEGWANVDELIEKVSRRFHPVDHDLIKVVVETNDKQRFSFSEDGLKIRANQGHSIPVDLGLTPIEPPEYLYHGTAETNVDAILEKGILKGSRQHVHLSLDKVTAEKVGIRHGKPIILNIRSGQMHRDGIHFYKSENDVWLTDFVSAQYIAFKRSNE
ncbi:MAG: RNA 2'-phosphotransferase [Bacteroidota bacterium]